MREMDFQAITWFISGHHGCRFFMGLMSRTLDKVGGEIRVEKGWGLWELPDNQAHASSTWHCLGSLMRPLPLMWPMSSDVLKLG